MKHVNISSQRGSFSEINGLHCIIRRIKYSHKPTTDERERQREKEKQTNNKNYYYFTLLFQMIQDIQSPHTTVPQWQRLLPILLPAMCLRPSSNISSCQLLWHLKTPPINHTHQNLEPIVFTCGRSWSWKKREEKQNVMIHKNLFNQKIFKRQPCKFF